VNELDHADADAQHSLKIGEVLGDHRTIAFCHKCIGRLKRMQAEQASGTEQDELLALSVDHLTKAVKRFNDLHEPDEVGDAYSLLGRTRLVQGEIEAAEAAVEKAQGRLSPANGKDYLDLQLVEADLAKAKGEADTARRLYTEVIEATDAGAGLGEVRGRALHKRGLLNNRLSAITDLEAAADVFEGLGQHEQAADAEIVVMSKQGRLPNEREEPVAARLLAEQPPSIQVLAVHNHEEEIEANARQGDEIVAYRSRPTHGHWEKMIERAQRQAAQRGRFW
jgi:tetratricopeptide (TPR) repeat protein